MTTPRYLPIQTLKDYVRSELQVDDGFYEEAINAAEMSLDNACGRRFEVAPATATARSFEASGVDCLYINDCTAITSVVDNVGTTFTAGTDFQALPLNGLSAAGEPWPYYVLRRASGYLWWPLYYPYPMSLVTVTAKWGWPAIPPQILSACKIIAKDEFAQRDVKFGLVAVSEAGGVGTRENRIVRDAVATYAYPSATLVMAG